MGNIHTTTQFVIWMGGWATPTGGNDSAVGHRATFLLRRHSNQGPRIEERLRRWVGSGKELLGLGLRPEEPRVSCLPEGHSLPKKSGDSR